jgi:hypothetical protein
MNAYEALTPQVIDEHRKVALWKPVGIGWHHRRRVWVIGPVLQILQSRLGGRVVELLYVMDRTDQVR